MPIKPENKARYPDPANWKEIRAQIARRRAALEQAERDEFRQRTEAIKPFRDPLVAAFFGEYRSAA